MYGGTADAGHFGVVGRQGTSSPTLAEFGASGVLGTAENNHYGVRGKANGTNAIGVFGSTDSGYGVVGSSDTGLSLWAGGGGRISQALRAAGAPTAGFFTAGEQIRDINGEMWLCVESGAPGTWRRAATVKEGFEGGSVNFLTAPVRLFDSRTGGPPIVPATNRTVQVTGASVPAGAKGVLGNLTVASTVGSGFLVLFATGAAAPSTASINWFASNQVLNTMAMSRLNAAGQLTIRNSSPSATHAVFDATGFVF